MLPTAASPCSVYCFFCGATHWLPEIRNGNLPESELPFLGPGGQGSTRSVVLCSALHFDFGALWCKVKQIQWIRSLSLRVQFSGSPKALRRMVFSDPGSGSSFNAAKYSLWTSRDLEMLTHTHTCSEPSFFFVPSLISTDDVLDHQECNDVGTVRISLSRAW